MTVKKKISQKVMIFLLMVRWDPLEAMKRQNHIYLYSF